MSLSSKKFERMAEEAVDVCLRVLKESNKSRFESYSVRNSELIVSHITFRDCRVHTFSDNLPRNGCISHGRSWAQFPSRTQNIFLSFLSTYIILFAEFEFGICLPINLTTTTIIIRQQQKPEQICAMMFALQC